MTWILPSREELLLVVSEHHSGNKDEANRILDIILSMGTKMLTHWNHPSTAPKTGEEIIYLHPDDYVSTCRWIDDEGRVEWWDESTSQRVYGFQGWLPKPKLIMEPKDA